MIRKSGVGIINYGAGNLASLNFALIKIGYRPHFIEKPDDFKNTKVVIIPGVGAFPQAMKSLQNLSLDKSILSANKKGIRIIGICLGMQILGEFGYEISKTKGLGLIKGNVLIHPDGLQVGWMSLNKKLGKNNEIIGNKVYFNHSFYLENMNENTLYTCKSSTINHPAIVKQNDVIGIQFHPEKSQQFGLKILGMAVRGQIS